MSSIDKNVLLKKNMKKTRLAIVFLDIINSTKFVQKHGAENAAIWFQVHDKLARNLVYRHRGREIDRSDGFMLSFDKLTDAIIFSLEYQKVIPKKTPFNSRIGIHWTEIIEIHQEDKYTAVGAKSVELEGIGKATAARCMSLCQEKQVLLTKDAFLKLKSMTNISKLIPKGTRTAMVGLYKFKGVKEPQIIYAIGADIERLQPPPSSEKAKRIGGSKKIKSRARDRKIKEWFYWFIYRAAFIEIIFFIYFSFYISLNRGMSRIVYDITGIDFEYLLSWSHPVIKFIRNIF